MTVKPVSFDALNREAKPYPSFLLPTEGTALSLFSAAFWGWNDGIHLIRAGLTVDFVDTDKDKLWEMATLMPCGHAFHVEDAWSFARNHEDSEQWDVVTIDPWVPMMDQVLGDLLLWCGLAKRLVSVGCLLADDLPPVPTGWQASIFPRNDRVGWLVLQR